MNRKKAKPRRPMRILKWALLVVGGLIMLPILEVGCVRYVDPYRTPEMLRFEIFGSEDAKQRGLKYHWISLEEIPIEQVRLIWASEDQRFFEHNGVDWEEIRLALQEAEEDGGKPRGASTITQQCARSLFLWQGRSWIRKGLEAVYTLLMEGMLSKRRILELYLNVIEFGDGVFGVRAASQFYFGREPSQLNRSQMALLAAIMPNPKEWSPVEPSARVRRRQQRVLKLEAAANFPEEKL